MSCTDLQWSSDIRYISSNLEIVPESGGVYKILRDDGEAEKLSRVYVGKATNLRNQYNYHLSDNDENDCLKGSIRNCECYFRFASLVGENNRQNAENHLLANGKYECNIQGQWLI